MTKRPSRFLGALLGLLALVGCGDASFPQPAHTGKIGAVSAGIFRQIPATYNPSLSGWPGAVGDIVQNAGSLSAWVRIGSDDTAWQLFPGGPGDWWTQRAAHAAYLLNKSFTGVDSQKRFDYSTSVPILSGTASPTIDHTKSGVVYKVANGQLNDMPISGATVIANPMSESWYVARWVNYVSSTLSGGAIWPIHLVADGNNFIDVALNIGFFYPDPILVLDSAGSLNVVDLGASCALGGPLSPIGSPITIGLFYDASIGSLSVECQDVTVKTILGSSGGLANMPIVPLALTTESNTASFNMLDYGGFAMIHSPLL